MNHYIAITCHLVIALCTAGWIMVSDAFSIRRRNLLLALSLCLVPIAIIPLFPSLAVPRDTPEYARAAVFGVMLIVVFTGAKRSI